MRSSTNISSTAIFETEHLKTRYRLLEAAAHLIAVEGYAATSVRRIAEAVGVTTGAIYRHFPGGKEELYDEILRFVAEAITRYLSKQTPDDAQSPVDIIVHQCGTYWDFFGSHPSFAALTLREGLNPERSPYLDEHLETIQRLKGLLQSAHDQGLIKIQSPSHFLFWVSSYCMSYHGAPAMRDALFTEEEQTEARAIFLGSVANMLSVQA